MKHRNDTELTTKTSARSYSQHICFWTSA